MGRGNKSATPEIFENAVESALVQFLGESLY